MSNLLLNAGFLEGVTGWSGSPAGLSLSVDETVRGAPGRMALVGKGVSTSGGQSFSLTTTTVGRADVSSAARLEVSLPCAAWVAGVPVPPAVSVIWWDASGAVLMIQPVAVRKPFLEAWPIGGLGVRDTYWQAQGLYERPALAVRGSVAVEAVASASGQTVELAMVKPSIAAARTDGHPAPWSPGAHTALDLKRPNWPSLLRALTVTSGGEANPAFDEFQAGSGPPMQRRISKDATRKLVAKIRCNALQRGVLESFAASTDKFWMVEPDSDRLCLAQWAASGAPRLVEVRGGLQIMELTIWLETA